MVKTVELCRENGRKGSSVPLTDFVDLTQFIITYLQRHRQITVFELIDEAVKHFDRDCRLQPTLLAVKQHLVNKGVLTLRFITGRNQLIELSNDFRRQRINMKNLIDQPHLKPYVKI